MFRPASDGGQLAKPGLVDIASSWEFDGRVVLNNIQHGMFVTFRAPNQYTLKRPIQQDQAVSLDDVEITDDQDIFALRSDQRAFLDG